MLQEFAATSRTGKAGTILYAMGTTQHTNGSQNIRAYSILQLLLANMGVAGGGINAMRGESNVQGSTDFGLLFDSIPGYLGMFTDADTTLPKYLERVTPKNKDPLSANWLSNYPKYITSILKAWYGNAGTKENDFGLNYLPKIETGKNYSWISLFEAMASKSKLDGQGQNPAVGGPNSDVERKALDNLEWLVASDLWLTNHGFLEATGITQRI
jgi:formate dehydrogenase major subunit